MPGRLIFKLVAPFNHRSETVKIFHRRLRRIAKLSTTAEVRMGVSKTRTRGRGRGRGLFF